MNKKYKRMTVILEYEDGFSLTSCYVFPRFRKKRNPASPFKEMEKDPIKWVEKMLNPTEY